MGERREKEEEMFFLEGKPEREAREEARSGAAVGGALSRVYFGSCSKFIAYVYFVTIRSAAVHTLTPIKSSRSGRFSLLASAPTPSRPDGEKDW
jgi:hypothetical protein